MGMSIQIKKALAEREMNIKQLAEKIDVTPGALRSKMHRDNLTERDLLKIAEALNCEYKSYFVKKENGEKI